MVYKVDSVKLYKIRKILSELSTKKGKGTELVSLYIPPKKALHEVTSSLRDEYGSASNIKSDATRTHVQDALTKTMQRLKLYKNSPDNGIIIFTGALPTNGPGSEEVFLHEVIPPKPVQAYLYRCDDHFHLDILKGMLKPDRVVGIISIDTTETGIGAVSGDLLDIQSVVTSGVSGKHRAGGQSARRFERLRDMELTSYYHRVADHASKAFLDNDSFYALIVSGPGPTKDFFLKEEFLDYRLQKKVRSVLDTSYSGREGVRETLTKSVDVLENIRIIEEKRLVQKFLRDVNTENGLAIYGLKEVLNRLTNSSVEVVLLSEDTKLVNLKIICRKCGLEKLKTVKITESISEEMKMMDDSCNNCGSTDFNSIKEDIVDYLEGIAIQFGAKIEIISSKTEEGAMLQSFSGVAAILRYR